MTFEVSPDQLVIHLFTKSGLWKVMTSTVRLLSLLKELRGNDGKNGYQSQFKAAKKNMVYLFTWLALEIRQVQLS